MLAAVCQPTSTNLLYDANISNNIAFETRFLSGRFHCRRSVVTYRCSRLTCVTGNTAAILVDPLSEVQQSFVELSQELKKMTH